MIFIPIKINLLQFLRDTLNRSNRKKVRLWLRKKESLDCHLVQKELSVLHQPREKLQRLLAYQPPNPVVEIKLEEFLELNKKVPGATNTEDKHCSEDTTP